MRGKIYFTKYTMCNAKEDLLTKISKLEDVKGSLQKEVNIIRKPTRRTRTSRTFRRR